MGQVLLGVCREVSLMPHLMAVIEARPQALVQIKGSPH